MAKGSNLAAQRQLRLQLIVPELTAPLFFGLHWRPLREKSVARQAKSEGRQYSNYVLLPGLDDVSEAVVGFYASPPADEGRKLPKGAASAAMAFANLVRDQDPSAGLALQLADGRYYTVVLVDGFVTLDQICIDADEARNALSRCSPIYSNDDVGFPGAEVSWEWLEQGAESARIKPVPVDPRVVTALVITFFVLAALMVGGFFWHQAQQKKKQLAAAAAAAAADPAPKYTAALVVAAPKAVLGASSWKNLISAVESKELTAPGWLRGDIACDSQQNACVSPWARKGGTSQELIQRLAGKEQVLIAADLASATSRSTATLTASPLELAGLPDAVQWREQHSATLQNWSTAGFNPRLSSPFLWPSAEGVPAEYKGADTIGRMAIALTGVQGAYLIDLLSSAPPGISWSNMTFALNHGEPARRVVVNLEGHIYVKHR
jgi:Pilin accessory protein (PilO)